MGPNDQLPTPMRKSIYNYGTTRRQTHFGNEAPPEAQGVKSCTEGCVLWGQHLRRWEGAVGRGGRSLRSRWIRRRKMGRGGQDTGDEKPRMTRKGAKSRKCRKGERDKTYMGNQRNQEETEQQEGRKQKGEGDERGRM